MKPVISPREALRLNLALQGGGAHGAFTWGVLDRLLEEESLAVNAVSGTSAGAMNAAALISGLMRGGREEARQSLERFWRKVSSRSRFNPFNRQRSHMALIRQMVIARRADNFPKTLRTAHGHGICAPWPIVIFTAGPEPSDCRHTCGRRQMHQPRIIADIERCVP